MDTKDMIEHIEGRLCEQGLMDEQYVDGQGHVRKFRKEGLEFYLSEILNVLKSSEEEHFDQRGREITAAWLKEAIDRTRI